MGQIQCSRGKFHTQLTLPLRESLGMKRSWSQLSFGVSTICFRDRWDERGLVTFPAIVQQRAQTASRHQNAPRRDRSASMHVFSQKLFSLGLLYIKKHGCFHFVRRSRNPLYMPCACFQKSKVIEKLVSKKGRCYIAAMVFLQLVTSLLLSVDVNSHRKHSVDECCSRTMAPPGPV